MNYWQEQSFEIRKEIEENYDKFHDALDTNNDFIQRMYEKSLVELEGVITYLNQKDQLISNDSKKYQDLFDKQEVGENINDISEAESFFMINEMGFHILKYALYKVRKSIALNYLTIIRYEIEKFKEDFVETFNKGDFKKEGATKSFLLVWDLKFGSNAVLNKDNTPMSYL